MSKKAKLISGISLLLVPVTAFAVHTANCCGDWICCLLGTGCC